MGYKSTEAQRAYQAEYYQRNKQRYLDQQQVNRDKIKAHAIAIKESTPCADCGMFYPHYAMDFDHLPQFTKVRNLSLIGDFGTIAKWDEERAKCELVCAICHRIRTYQRAQASGVSGSTPEA